MIISPAARALPAWPRQLRDASIQERENNIRDKDLLQQGSEWPISLSNNL